MLGDDEGIRNYKELADDYRAGMARQDRLIAAMKAELDAKDASTARLVEYVAKELHYGGTHGGLSESECRMVHDKVLELAGRSKEITS